MRPVLLATLLVVTLLAGCAQDPPAGDDEPDRGSAGSGAGGAGDPTDPLPTARATVTVDHGDLRDDEPVQTVVTFDPGSRPAMHLYNDTGTPRPDAYTVHDLLVDWSQESGVPVTVEHHAALGYSVTSIDGVTAHSTQGGRWHWALFVDGERNTEGIGSIPVEDDAEYEWRFTHTPS